MSGTHFRLCFKEQRKKLWKAAETSPLGKVVQQTNRIFILQYFLFVSWNVKIWPTAQHLYSDDKTPTFIFLKKVDLPSGEELPNFIYQLKRSTYLAMRSLCMSGLQTLLLLVGTVTCFLDWNSFELLKETFYFPKLPLLEQQTLIS